MKSRPSKKNSSKVRDLKAKRNPTGGNKRQTGGNSKGKFKGFTVMKTTDVSTPILFNP